MVIAVIPSRFASSRFPGKALIPVAGIPMVVRVARRVVAAGVADRVLVATDDERIARVVEDAGLEVLLNDEAFRSGSDRVAAAIEQIAGEVVLNVQGDEPLVDARTLDAALAALAGCEIGTVASPLRDAALLEERDAVKVAVDREGRAVRFSRLAAGEGPLFLHHGVYSFTRDSLQRFARLPSTAGELAEGLEQLRALERGWRIGVRVVDTPALSVNRPGDVPRLERLLNGPGGGGASWGAGQG